MTNLINFSKITVEYASATFKGHGHFKINVELKYQGNVATFNATTNNMPDFDAANELEGQNKYNAYYEIISNQIHDQVDEAFC